MGGGAPGVEHAVRARGLTLETRDEHQAREATHAQPELAQPQREEHFGAEVIHLFGAAVALRVEERTLEHREAAHHRAGAAHDVPIAHTAVVLASRDVDVLAQLEAAQRMLAAVDVVGAADDEAAVLVV